MARAVAESVAQLKGSGMPVIDRQAIFRKMCLTRHFEHQVAEAYSRKLIPGIIYLAPPNYHLMVEEDRTFSLSVDPPVNFARPSIDVLFETAVDAYGWLKWPLKIYRRAKRFSLPGIAADLGWVLGKRSALEWGSYSQQLL